MFATFAMILILKLDLTYLSPSATALGSKTTPSSLMVALAFLVLNAKRVSLQIFWPSSSSVLLTIAGLVATAENTLLT
jgi:hypothetical protein